MLISPYSAVHRSSHSPKRRPLRTISASYNQVIVKQNTFYNEVVGAGCAGNKNLQCADGKLPDESLSDWILDQRRLYKLFENGLAKTLDPRRNLKNWLIKTRVKL